MPFVRVQHTHARVTRAQRGHTCARARSLKNERASPSPPFGVMDEPRVRSRTYRSTWKKHVAASTRSSTPSVPLIKLGTRFECSLDFSTSPTRIPTVACELVSVCLRARVCDLCAKLSYAVWRVRGWRLLEYLLRTLELQVVGSELARGSSARGLSLITVKESLFGCIAYTRRIRGENSSRALLPIYS